MLPVRLCSGWDSLQTGAIKRFSSQTGSTNTCKTALAGHDVRITVSTNGISNARNACVCGHGKDIRLKTRRNQKSLTDWNKYGYMVCLPHSDHKLDDRGQQRRMKTNPLLRCKTLMKSPRSQNKDMSTGEQKSATWRGFTSISFMKAWPAVDISREHIITREANPTADAAGDHGNLFNTSCSGKICPITKMGNSAKLRFMWKAPARVG
eukprot:gnl/TRDRNA2_/TRDRNA2_53138_c0_seq1.p2 gnl/TRDRNA2_/TRDRNA2_53138_c0~~gnl/TRDRNA2_/TRDRNA2_53138_c0_seq1.p2  ORF type:complete len:208 (-),score=21.64 gnl/TRDRNA2_/TRDRNA2_53138_c0_seq1:63-686(-)